MKRIILPAFFLITIYTVSAQQRVGIGTNTPAEKLDVAGNIKGDTVKPKAFKLSTNAGQGKVLTSDAAGNGNWSNSNGGAPISNIGYGVWGDCATNGNISEYQPVADTATDGSGQLGYSVGVSGDFAIVGIPYKRLGDNLNQGSACFYKFNGTYWEFTQMITDLSGLPFDNFGYAVAISGNYAIVGAPSAKVGSIIHQGAVFIYQYNGSTWLFKQTITNSGGAANDNFGTSVSISGDNAIVGSPYDKINANLNQGSANIYKYNGSNWIQQQYLYETTGANASDNFGRSVSISGSYAAVGIPGPDAINSQNNGSANIYKFNGTNWVFLQKVKDYYGEKGELFGFAVSISGNYLIVGSPFDNYDLNLKQGSASIYKFDGSSWLSMQKITAYTPVSNLGRFGFSVCISNDYAIVGATNDNENKGAACIYLRVGQGWQKLQTVTDPGGSGYNAFGWSVGFSGPSKRFLIGVPFYGDNNLGKVVFGKIN